MTAHDFKMIRAIPSPLRLSHGRALVFTPGQIAILAGLMLVVASIPIWTNPLPPLSDYVNHLARMKVISAIGSDPNLARFYEIDWQVIPNLMMDLIVPLIARVVTIYHAGQIFLVLMFALIVSGTLAFHRALAIGVGVGRHSSIAGEDCRRRRRSNSRAWYR